MPDWVAIWGAVTGTVAVAIAGRRELLLNRPRLGIEHGVWLLLDDDPDAVPDLAKAWLTIRMWNDGGQPLTVEQVGVHVHPIWDDAERGLVIFDEEGCQAEIELGGAQVELHPGGPSRTFFAPLMGLIKARIDVLQTPGAAWAITSDGKVWRGEVHSVVSPHRVPERFRQAVEREQAARSIGGEPDVVFRHVRLPNEGPPSQSGVIYG